MLRRLDEVGRTTWASHVKNITVPIWRRIRIWLADEIGDVSAFVELFKTRVKESTLQNLTEKLNTSSKTVYYRHFKTMLNTERFLSIDLHNVYKKATISI